MAEPTKQGGEARPGTPGAEDDANVRIDIPADQVHPALANSPHPNQQQTYTVTVNGRQEQWSLDKVLAEAQQGAAGREKFQEAANIRKEAAKALALQEDMEAAFEGDADAFRRLGASMGVPGDKVEELIESAFGDGDDDDDDDEDVIDSYYQESSRTGKSSNPNSPVDYSRLSPDIQRVLREAETARINKIVDSALDKDEVVSYNMSRYTPEGRAAIRRFVDDKIRGRLNQFNGDFGDGTRILAEVLPEIREHLQALDIPSQRTRTGLGHAPGGGDTEVYPKKLPDHVPSSEGDAYEQNILETLAYYQSQAERGQQ